MESHAVPVQDTSDDLQKEIDNKDREKINKDCTSRGSSKDPSESTDGTLVDTIAMDEQLRIVHKEVSERRSEKGFGEANWSGQFPHPGEINPDDNTVYKKALTCVPEYINRISLDCQVEISKLLNVEREDYQDYRLIAASLRLETFQVNTLENAQNPMMAIFKQCGSKSGKDLVEALFCRNRFDAMRVLVQYHERGILMQTASCEEARRQITRQNALSSSYNENMFRGGARSRPMVEESSRDQPRSKSTGTTPATNGPLVPDDQLSNPGEDESKDQEEWRPEVLKFWNSIGESDVKTLKVVKKAFEEMAKTDKSFKAMFGYTWKGIVHTLRLKESGSSTQVVTPENFKRMIAFLGPPSMNDNGCLKWTYSLLKKSVRKVERDGDKLDESWFAGHIDPEDAESRLENCRRGTFLVRFSTSKADEGWYALSIKTESSGVHSFSIEQEQTKDGARRFTISGIGTTTFENLWDLVSHYELQKIVDDEEEISERLLKPCPKLPLNSMCKGYKKARR